MRSKRVVLFSLLDQVKFGGANVYTAHLARSLRQMGYAPMIVRVVKQSRRGSHGYTHSERFHYASLSDALGLARSFPSLITFYDWKKCRRPTLELLRHGVPVVIHDPIGFSDSFFDTLGTHHNRVILIRRANAEALRKRGLASTFIPHPYIRSLPAGKLFSWQGTRHSTRRLVHAVCVGRLDFWKHQEIIAEANTLLPTDKRVQMHGAENRMFGHHTLDAKWPGWRSNYHGTFPADPDAATCILAGAKMAIDLSVLKDGDGDGTQYSFLEAWDAGTPLIVHGGWVRTGKDSVRPGENVLAVSNAHELVEALLDDSPRDGIVAGGLEELELHKPEKVIPLYEEILGVQRVA